MATAIGFLEVDQPGAMLWGRMPMIPSCASLLTSTTTAKISRVLPLRLLGSTAVPSWLLAMSQHRRSFVEVLVKELSIRSIIIRWRDPFPWHNAWESYAYASGAVDPARRRSPGELLAEVGCEVVAVLGEEVVGGALEFFGGLAALARFSLLLGNATPYLMYDRVKFLYWAK